MTDFTVLFSELFLIVGVITGWIASERYHDFMEKEAHPHDELFNWRVNIGKKHSNIFSTTSKRGRSHPSSPAFSSPLI